MERSITTLLSDKSQELIKSDTPTMIKVDHVSMDFNIANQQLNSLKEYFIALLKRQLIFKSFRALDDVSIEVQKGDVYGILGTNGSGKSTLLKIVSGVLEPSEGKVAICGNIAPLIEMGAGFDHELTARENIYLNGSLLGYSKKFIEQHFDEIVEFSEVGDFLDMPLKNYSSGMVSRIAFAIATIIIPEILIVDEVLAVGDFMFRQKCEKRIQSLIRDHGTTVLIVSHSSPQIERLCNKAIWIEKGHTRMVGTAREVSRTYQALGGHSGSPEAEQFIFNLINDKSGNAGGFVKRITGQDGYAIDAQLKNELACELPAKYVVLSCGEDLGAQLIALSAAAALGGVPLVTKRDMLPDPIAATLAHLAPQHLLIINHGNIQENVILAAQKVLPSTTIITEIASATLEDLSLQTEELTRELKLIPSKTLFISDANIGKAAAAISPYIYKDASPFVVCSNEKSIEKIAELIGNHHPQEVILLGSPKLPDDWLSSQSQEKELTVKHFSNEEAVESFSTVPTWVISAMDINAHAIYVTPYDEKVNAISVAPLAAQNDAAVLIVDHNNLDSMMAGAEFIVQHGRDTTSLNIVGIDTSFNSVDVEIFSKALVRAKNS